MKTSLSRPLITLTVAASVALLAGCLEQTRQASQLPPAVPTAAVPAREPDAIVRPDPSSANVSSPVAEIARLHQSGLDESVVKAFVEKSTNALNPTADELIFLKDIGVSPRVITAMIQQTAKVREQVSAAATVAPAAVARPNVPTEARPNMTVIAANANPPAAPAVSAAPQPPTVVPIPDPQVTLAPAQPAPIVQPAPANLPQQVTVFYQQLQPYGTWMQVADYGWCWQPTVVVSTPTWRPYADRGRWLHTDNGWYWQSDYAWGWAPFHYGRWVLHSRSGWLWVPDTTWGPAWVVWRSSTAHCGWAPLPPSAVFVAGSGLRVGGVSVGLNFDFGLARHHYTFIPFTRFCDRNPHYYALAPTVVQNVFNQTTVINNIQVNNNVVVNSGISADRIATLTRSEIRKVSVREVAPQEQTLSRLDKLEKSGNDLVIYRPALNPNAPVKLATLTNSKGETRTELVPAGALLGQKIAGRAVYDTTSTGVPVLTGYTTEPQIKPSTANVVVINNTIATAPQPTPATSAAPVASATPAASDASQSNYAGRSFGINRNLGGANRAEEISARQSTVIIPNPADNSLFRPMASPQPLAASPPQNLTPPSPVSTSPPPATRREVTKPQTSSNTSAAIQPSSTPAPVAPSRPGYSPASPQPSSQPSAARPTTSVPAPSVQVQPVAPIVARPTVVISPPPQPSSAPAPGASSTTKSEQEKRK